MRARRHRNSLWIWVVAVATLLLPTLPLVTANAQGIGARKAGHAAPVVLTSLLNLQVRSSRTSTAAHGPKALDPIPNYKWLINLDNTGNPGAGKEDPACHPSTNASYPTGCYWPSIRYAVASPALTEGTQQDWSMATALPTYNGVNGLPDQCDGNGNPIPAGTTPAAPAVACRYLVSVTADGYQIGGAHFTAPMPAPGNVEVFLNPFPIPLGTIRLRVFSDTKPTDGTFDEQNETGLVNFLALVNDVDGILQADYFGNPLCTKYQKDKVTGKIVLDARSRPIQLPAAEPAPPTAAGYYNPTIPGRCLSDTNGDIVIPNMAPNHYSVIVTPPDDSPQRWIQTTTLEGNHDHDVWVMPDSTGLDTELMVGGESVPFVDFGFTPATAPPASWVCPAGGVVGQTSGCGQIKGQIFAAIPYVPGLNGLPGVGGANGQSGMKLDRPIDRGWVSLNNLNASTGDTDTMVATIPTDKNGYFTINNVPDGDYTATIWDEPQEYALDNFAVTISHGQIVDMGTLPLLGWFSHIYGHVFVDLNGNGRQDPGEPGIFHAFVQNLNRTNNTMVGGIANSYTDNNGLYDFREAYPIGLMSINQFFNTRYKTTGVTWQACNDPKEHTVVAPMVDVSYLPIIGQCGRLDWGVVPYNPSANGDNGGIVATMFEDQARQKFNARQAQTGDFQTGIPGFRFEQYTPIKALPTDPTVDPVTGALLVDPLSGYKLRTDPGHEGQFQTLETLTPPDGKDCSSVPAYVQGTTPLCYVSENNAAPAKCYPKDANGNPVTFDPTNPRSLDFMISGGACIETSAESVQFGLGTDNAGAPLNHPVQTVDGNYTLGNGSTIPAKNLGDTLVRPVVPVDHVLGLCPAITGGSQVLPPGCDAQQAGLPRKLYTYTSEEDVNLFSGAQYVPQGADQSNLAWPPRANYFSGSATGVTANTLTDAPQAWIPGTFVGDKVKMGGVTATVTANTANTLTFAAGWSGGVAPPAGAYTVRGSEIIPGNYDENQYTYAPGIDPICADVTHTVHVTNADLLANGGSPLEGQLRHSCGMKLLNVQAGQSIAPNFHVHTAVDVPLPAHYWGYIVDDVSVETNRKSYNIGEVHGIPGVPIGVYDWTGRRNYTATSDYNGVWEVLMPSEDINNCLTPAGTCPNVYRFVGNDPGQPGAPNLSYDPNYRTIAADFEAWPNMLVPADVAPTRVVPSLEGPGVQFTSVSPCGVKAVEPQLLAVSPAPYTRATSMTLTIQGANFGTSGHVEFAPDNGDTPLTLRQVGAWTDHQVQVTIGTDATAANGQGIPEGPGMLTVVSGVNDPVTGRPARSTSGVTFHVIGGGYQPTILEVGPGKQFDPFAVDGTGKLLHPFPIQDALELAASRWQTYGIAQVRAGRTIKSVANDPKERFLVVVYPKWDPSGALNTPFVPLGTYFENLLVHSPVKLQGVGPGGIYPDPTTGLPVSIQGSIIDGRFFNTVSTGAVDTPPPGMVDPAPDTNEPALLHWVNLLDAIELSPTGTGFLPTAEDSPTNSPWSGQNEPLGEGAVVTVLGTTGTYASRYHAAVDGFTISGGDQRDFPGNISEIGGTKTAKLPEAGTGGEGAGAVNTQGGAVYVNGGTDHYQISNNIVRQNSGSYGTIRIGTVFHGSPQVAGGASHNHDAVITHNQVAFNGGTNLAGAVGIFDDSNAYSVDHNTFCMNASMEYGGAISHFGYSPDGQIHDNKMFLNTAFDEGGAIVIASEGASKIVAGADGNNAVPDPNGMTEGSGAVSVDHNYISVNLAQDDGGALRIMGTAGTRGLAPITLTNNMINNNISSHEGGAISINDAPLVNIVNNTFSGNVTTATALTSNGAPAPAGISSGLQSAGLNQLLATPAFQAGIPDWMASGTWPQFSSPLIENNIFWDNRAGSWTPNGVAGIGMPGDLAAINLWDVGSVDAGANLRVRDSILNSSPTAPSQTFQDDGGNKFNQNPGFVGPYTTMLQIVQQRHYFRFRPSAIISVDLPDNALGDYHLLNIGSPAHAMGANPQDLEEPLIDDIDGNPRPGSGGIAPTPVTAGAHEVTALPVGLAVKPAGPQPGVPPLGLPGGSSTPAATVGGVVRATVGLVPVRTPHSRSGGNGGTPSSVAPAAAAGLGGGTLLDAMLGFEKLPEHQADTGLAALVALSLLLAAFQLGRDAIRKRRKTVPVQSDEAEIEGGEQL